MYTLRGAVHEAWLSRGACLADVRSKMNAGKLLGSIGEQIRLRRVEAGLTQRELGEQSGIVGKYVSEIERGTRDIPLSTLFAIVERGLHMELRILFRRRQNGAESALPMRVEEVARSVAELPADQQVKLVALIRGMLELARAGH